MCSPCPEITIWVSQKPHVFIESLNTYFFFSKSIQFLKVPSSLTLCHNCLRLFYTLYWSLFSIFSCSNNYDCTAFIVCMFGTVPCMILSLHKDTPKYGILLTMRRSNYYNCNLFLLSSKSQNFRLLWIKAKISQHLQNDLSTFFFNTKTCQWLTNS